MMSILKKSIMCRCPRCGVGAIYAARYSFSVNSVCSSCGLCLSKNDSADGPAVFLIFVLGFLLVPLALLLEFTLHPALWVHAVVWTVVALGLTLGLLKPLKSLVIALQFHYRPGGRE